MVKVHPKFMRQNSRFQETKLLCRVLQEGYLGITIQLLLSMSILMPYFKQYYKLLRKHMVTKVTVTPLNRGYYLSD